MINYSTCSISQNDDLFLSSPTNFYFLMNNKMQMADPPDSLWIDGAHNCPASSTCSLAHWHLCPMSSLDKALSAVWKQKASVIPDADPRFCRREFSVNHKNINVMICDITRTLMLTGMRKPF